MKKKALILFSGGQDSTTCLFWAIKKYGKDNVLALGFFYGQRHSEELECAKKICKKLEISYEVLDLSILNSITKNALTSQDIEISQTKNELPTTFVPGRNVIFISLAASYAYERKINDIIMGVSDTDYSGYPDCRSDFIKSMEITLQQGLEFDFNIITPLMHLDKAGVWNLSKELGCFDIVMNDTITCYNGIVGAGCGECPACVLRKKGLEQLDDK